MYKYILLGKYEPDALIVGFQYESGLILNLLYQLFSIFFFVFVRILAIVKQLLSMRYDDGKAIKHLLVTLDITG